MQGKFKQTEKLGKSGKLEKSGKFIQTSSGAVRPAASDCPGVEVYKGIPIGQDTGGANRFGRPQKVQPWEGVRDCAVWPDRFLQAKSKPEGFWYREFYQDPAYAPPYSENGLAVNLYAPVETGEEPLPVFVYIHGGGMVAGYESEEEFNASRLAAQGVIVVLPQYRLGVFGWLCLPELSASDPQKASGNQAVLDLVFALEWIRDNIAAFGGDPDKVTIAGQSAGAGMVTNLLRTPLAKGLFRGAIIQSGFDGFLLGDGMMNRFLSLAEAEAKNEAALEKIFQKKMTLDELRKIPAQDFYLPAPDGRTGFDGCPVTLLEELNQETTRQVLDGYVFTEKSADLFAPGALDGVSIMIGGTSDEATSLVGDVIWQMEISPQEAKTRLDSQFGEGCSAVYPTGTTEEARFSVLRALSDQSLQKYLLSIRRTQQNRNHAAFAYYFTHVPPGEHEEVFGAYHSSELWFMFDSLRNKKEQRKWRSQDEAMARMMSRYWMNFVKNGTPNDGGVQQWEPCAAENQWAFAQLENGTLRMRTETDAPDRDRFHREQLERF